MTGQSMTDEELRAALAAEQQETRALLAEIRALVRARE